MLLKTKTITVFTVLLIVLISTSTTFAASKLHRLGDWKVGPFVMGNTFDMDLATSILGKMKSMENAQYREGGTPVHIKFEYGYLTVMDNKIRAIVTSAKNIETPRGIFIGSPVEDIIEQYGFPPRTRKLKESNETSYEYGGDGSYIGFSVNNSTGLVSHIAMNIPTC